MKKNLVLVLLASFLVVGSIGCSNTNNGNSSAPSNESAVPTAENGDAGKINFDEEPYTIKVNYAVLGQEQPDLPKIEAKLNEITLKEINAKIDLEGVSLYNMANVYALKASSREKTDLMLLMPGNRYLASFANNKMIRPIDEELAQWGPALTETLGDNLISGQFNGKQYAIPQKADQKNTIGFHFSKSILDKYNIDVSNIKSLSDLDSVFAIVHEKEPNMTVLAPEVSVGNIASILKWNDGLGNAYGGLLDPNSTKLENMYESEEFVETIKKVREWYQKGYISKDVNTSQDDGATLLDNGKVFAVAASSVGFAGGSIKPIEKQSIAMYPPVLTTSDTQLLLWSVASSSERPDKAIQFLNLLNSSAELTTLLQFGIEGEHYEVNANGTLNVSNNKNYESYWPMFGDYSKAPLSETYVTASGLSVEEFKLKQKAWNDNTKKSIAYGFIFDPGPVKTEIAALDAVAAQYAKVIGNGAVDPTELLKKFNDSLYAAGLQKVMDEKQRQFDAWLATNNK
ncbi:ABC transporter substrate-binding protein [Paenibacillus sinopodophylli]|uniref:ABC transporter substrate-binding protein n=1 Tax=Paenibacillus sinopodophylli TaxID=1837342 RepID=UPI00110CCF83|nr:ABC transporter substrate-binding protein [Paenibacillus sinopodophylli]